jgi:hypothetical protein
VSTTPTPRTTAAILGGVLWTLLPLAWAVAAPQSSEYGSLSFVAVAASFWIFLVLPPALLAAGIPALRRALGATPGRVAMTGLVVAAVGYTAMAVGNGIEVASLSFGGGEVDWGHMIFLGGFLTSVVGGILLGIVVFRRRRDALSRVSAGLLALALPLGIGIGVLGSAIAPGNDAGFWAAIAVPTGVAWILLGRSMRSVPETAAAADLAAAR